MRWKRIKEMTDFLIKYTDYNNLFMGYPIFSDFIFTTIDNYMMYLPNTVFIDMNCGNDPLLKISVIDILIESYTIDKTHIGGHTNKLIKAGGKRRVHIKTCLESKRAERRLT